MRGFVSTCRCLDIADANLELPFTIVAAANEGRVRGDGDTGSRDGLVDRRSGAKSLADLERVAAQRLGGHSSRHRQKMRQHVGGDTKRHQRRQMRSQLVQLWSRPAMWSPADASRVVTTADAAKPREPYRHRAEQRRDRMMLPVFDVASAAARRTLRTQNRMIPRLRGDDLLLHANQNLLRLGERQPQVANLPKSAARV